MTDFTLLYAPNGDVTRYGILVPAVGWLVCAWLYRGAASRPPQAPAARDAHQEGVT